MEDTTRTSHQGISSWPATRYNLPTGPYFSPAPTCSYPYRSLFKSYTKWVGWAATTILIKTFTTTQPHLIHEAIQMATTPWQRRTFNIEWIERPGKLIQNVNTQCKYIDGVLLLNLSKISESLSILHNHSSLPQSLSCYNIKHQQLTTRNHHIRVKTSPRLD